MHAQAVVPRDVFQRFAFAQSVLDSDGHFVQQIISAGGAVILFQLRFRLLERRFLARRNAVHAQNLPAESRFHGSHDRAFFRLEHRVGDFGQQAVFHDLPQRRLFFCLLGDFFRDLVKGIAFFQRLHRLVRVRLRFQQHLADGARFGRDEVFAVHFVNVF